MSWRAVARKDFQDAVRSRTIWAISALFVVLTAIVALAIAVFPDAVGLDASSPSGVAFFAANTIATFVSITAILLCYKSIAGERESGSVKLLLSLPHTRGEVVVGKVVGRTAVLSIPVVVALLLGSVVGWLAADAMDPVVTAALLLVGVLFALSYVGLMVGLSAMIGSASRAAALGVGFFFVFEMLWDVVVLALAFVANGFALNVGSMSFPAWLYPISLVRPTRAFTATLEAAFPGGADAGSMATGGGMLPSAGSLDAVYASPWLGLVVLLLWLIVPLAIGTRLFGRADL